MNWHPHLLRGAAIAVLGATPLLGCRGKKTAPLPPDPAPVALEKLEIRKVSADLAKPDPAAAYWSGWPDGIVMLMAQPMIAPRPETTTTDKVMIKAVTDGKLLALRVKWADAEASYAGRLGEFSDALALEFPVKLAPLPPVFMGAKDQPVHLFHWRAQYQRDHEQGKPTMTAIYPNMSVDMYPMEFKDQPDAHKEGREQFSPGVAVGNPQAYTKSGVDEIIAEGFSTSSVQKGNDATAGHAVWKDGQWTLVIVRPLATEGGSNLVSGQPNYVGFAAWQGGKGEVASRKSVTMNWIPVVVP